MQYTTENTEGYSSYDLGQLNGIYEHRIALLDEDERENADLLQHISEQVLADYDAAREQIPYAIGSDEGPLRVVRIRDLIPADDSEITITLLDVRTSDGLTLEGRLVCILPDGRTETAHGEHDQIRTHEDIATDNQGAWLPVEDMIPGPDDYKEGWVAYRGRTYGLKQQAYCVGLVGLSDGMHYLEDAYAASATEIETGRSAMIYWVEREEYDPEMQDESDACDWDHPARVEILD
ncbi:MAG: hypothetical protein WC343_12475 [Bacilli bacterium]|jgi:hypothetical protein